MTLATKYPKSHLNVFLSPARATVGNIDYQLHWPPGTKIEEEILGPLYPPDFLIPETPLGTIGALIPLIAAIGLVTATKKKTGYPSR